MTAGEVVPTTQIIATGAAHDDWIELAHEAAIQAAMATTNRTGCPTPPSASAQNVQERTATCPR